MDQKAQQYLQHMGIQTWHPKTVETHTETPSTGDVTQLDWNGLAKRVSGCTACGLEKSRTQTVFGAGNQQAELMIVGEAPGFYEDKQGAPFVGRAGQLLTMMLESIGYTREQVYIANILKCRPPNNRDPQVNEVNLCTPYLARQITLLQPKLILAVGRIAAQFLLQVKTPLSQLRNKVHAYPVLDTPLMVTYHPAYLLRNSKEKKKAFADLLQVRARLA